MKLGAYWSTGGESVIIAGRGVLLHLTKKQAAALAKKLVTPPKRRRR